MAKLPPIILVLDNIRSAHNVGAIWRTAEAAGVDKLVLVGITPHPAVDNDARLPHEVRRAEAALAKTALGAQAGLGFDYYPDVSEAIKRLKDQGYHIAAIEQSAKSVGLFKWRPLAPMALIMGNEVDGVSQSVLASVDSCVEIPMLGRKESLNVAVATGIVLYFLRNYLAK